MSASYIRKTGGIVRIGNAWVELAFDLGKGGGLAALTDKKSGWQFIRDRAAAPSLCRLALRTADNEILWVDGSRCRQLRDREGRETGKAKLVLEARPVKPGKLRVRIEVSLTDNSGLSVWRAWVSGVGKNQAVHRIVYPVVAGFSKPGETVPGETLVHPCHSHGVLYRQPFPLVEGLPMRAGSGTSSPSVGLGQFALRYPGETSMQFALYYHDRAGLYLACHDDQLNVKGFACEAVDGRYPTLSIAHYPSEQRGADVARTYETLLGVFHGDWHDGACLYRDWAEQQWWCRQKLSKRHGPAWLKKGFAVWQMSNYHMPKLKLNHPIKQIAAEVNALSKKTGVPFAALVFNFEKDGAWTGPHGMFPPREGGKPFRAAMRSLRRNGNHGFLYVPGGQYYVNAKFYDPPFDAGKDFAAHAVPGALCKVGGKPHLYDMISKQVGEWVGARMCPVTPYTRRMTADMVLGCLKLGADLVQIDNFPCCSPEACFNPAHGHPMGFGPWYTKAWIDLLVDVRRKAAAINPACALTAEGIAECYIPFLDLYDMRGPDVEYWRRQASDPANGEPIPLFGFVYGGYIGGYLAAFPECNRPEVLYWTRCFGKALANGVVPTGGHYFPEPKAYNPITLAFFEKVVRAAAQECWKYIMFGRMLKPPTIDSPDIDAMYLPFRSDFNSLDETRPQFLQDKAIQHSRWLAEDGTTGYIMVNVSREPVAFTVALESSDGTRGPFRIRAIVDGKPRLIRRRQRLPHQLNLRMEALSVMLVELARRR